MKDPVVFGQIIGRIRLPEDLLSGFGDLKTWEKVWQAGEMKTAWQVPLTHFHAGIDAPGREARYIKLETNNKEPAPLLLQRLRAYGETGS